MTALARKYRPTQLSDLVGQDPLRTALKAAFETGRLAQAYVLTGVRGVGKTTTARIIARSVNCENGPTLTSCGSCASCREIASDSSLDVVEIDAASNNGVDNIRTMIEHLSYAPMVRGARRIYILDEAHMLSNAAWNALLKTLEEPPAHVMFIFATTEPRKIPATVLSRCQKFALRRIDAATIAAHLETIAEKENVSLEPGVSLLIGQAGDGSMRDALSILDQAISAAAGGAVSADLVRDMVGRATPRAMIDLIESISTGESQAALAAWRAILNAGIEPLTALDDLSFLVHQVQLATLAPGLASETGLSPEDAQRLAALGARFKPAYFTGAQKLLFENRPVIASHPSRAQAAEILVLRLVQGFGYKG